jgi:hypothetical protein
MSVMVKAPAEKHPRPHDPNIVPTAPSASIIGGTFVDVEGALGVVRGVRSAGSTPDIVGIATPLAGDPTSADALETLVLPARKKRGFDVLGWLMTAIDPHPGVPTYRTLTRGRNSVLARPVLGSVGNWLMGVEPFRVPDPNAPDGGVWVLGRPNHAAAVAGAAGAALGGAVGALASLGLPKDYMQEYKPRQFAGETILTLCETDEGRVQRDYKLMGKHGAAHRFIARDLRAPERQQV